MNLRGVVEQKVKHVVAFMLISTNNSGVDGNMVSNQRVGHHTLFQAKVLLRMSRVDSKVYFMRHAY